MDFFEGIIATLLEAEGCWVRRSFKIDLTKEEKRAIGKHSIPRPEIDLLAFSQASNRLIVLEVKSFLDSSGVKLESLKEKHEIPEGRYKLFTCDRYRDIALSGLRRDLVALGMANDNTSISLGLAAGNVHKGETSAIRNFMEKNGWFFWSPEDIKVKVTKLAERDYENDPVIITAKILYPFRGRDGSRRPSSLLIP